MVMYTALLGAVVRHALCRSACTAGMLRQQAGAIRLSSFWLCLIRKVVEQIVLVLQSVFLKEYLVVAVLFFAVSAEALHA